MKLKLLATVSLTLAATTLYAQSNTYQFEAAYQNLSSSVDDGTKQSGNQFSGKYYLNPVSITAGAPLFELEFLQRASNIAVSYAQVNYEDTNVASTNIDVPQLAGKLYLNNVILGVSTSPWNKDIPLKAGGFRGTNTNTINYEIGYFVMPNTSVSYINGNSKATYSANAGLNDLTITTNGLSSRTLMQISGGQHLAFTLTYNQINRKQTTSQDNTEYGGSLRYYPQSKMYLDVGYKENSGNYANSVGNTLSFGAGYAITPRLGLTLTSDKFTASNNSLKASGTTTVLAAGYRF